LNAGRALVVSIALNTIRHRAGMTSTIAGCKSSNTADADISSIAVNTVGDIAGDTRLSILSEAEVAIASSTGIVDGTELAVGDVAFQTDGVVGTGLVPEVACHASCLVVGADRAELDSAPSGCQHSERGH
jgi:hypothetical protein